MTEKKYKIESAAISDRGLSEKRPQNEDSFIELNKQGLFVVADGVGGAQAGDVASQMAVEILGEAFVNLKTNGDAEDLMQIAIERANEAIYQMSHDLASLSTMATTIVALHVAGNIATIGHVGDSRLYRIDPKGNFFRETQDHSVVEEEVRAGRMTEAQAINHPSRNVISRAVGADHAVEVDLKTIMIEPNTTFLLCSDGITRHIDDFQLRELLIFKDTPENICARMKEICYERGAEDNLTAVIVRVTDKIIETSAADLEESTVAAARPVVGNDSFAKPTYDGEEMPTQPLTMPTGAAFETTETDYADESPISPTQDSIAAETARENAAQSDVVKKQPQTLQAAKRANQSSSLFSHLTLLVIGWILGAGIMYLWTRNNQPAEVPAPMQTQTVEYKNLEDRRREVDRQSEIYVVNNVSKPQSAEDFYLLGRAYLLTGKFTDAKIVFTEAKNKLATASETNQRILGNEIAMGLAIIENSEAQKKFQSEISK